MTTNAPRKIDSVTNTCRILEVLRERGGAGVTEIAAEVDVSKSAVHGHLATLRDEGFVVKDGHTYSLSLRFVDLAEHVKNQVADHQIVKDVVTELAEETGEVVHFATEENGRVVYLSKARGDSAVETASEIGMRTTMHSTSLGKAMLAEFRPERVDDVVETHGMVERTASTITDRDRLHEELERTRERGYAVDDEENLPGVRCIGKSVSTPTEDVLGALSITGPSQRMTDERMATELHDAIAQAANVIEVNSMYS